MTDDARDKADEPNDEPIDAEELEGPPVADEPIDEPAVARRSWVDRLHAAPLESWITFAVVATCALFVFTQLHPFKILSDTTPAGGDMGAHVWGPAYLRDHLLPAGRLSGWSPDWYAGFPAYHFYMVVPSLLVVLLGVVLPYGAAFKLVTVSGVVTMPIACWFLGRRARLPFPGPPLLAIGGLAFLFDRSFSIYGGNIASTLAGEFAFSMSLSLSIFFLGILVGGFETGRDRGWGAVVGAVAALCHVIPFLFVVTCTVLWLVLRPGRGRLVWAATVGLVGGALMAFWYLPFWGRRGYLNDMGWEKITSDRYRNYLWDRSALDPQLVNSPDLRIVIALAAVGLLLSIVYRRRFGLLLALAAIVFAVAFMVVPQGRLWNARLLPFYYFSLYLLAALGIAEMGRLIAALVAPDVHRPVRLVKALTPIVAGLGVVILLGMSLRTLPFGRVTDGGRFEWGAGPLSLSTTDRSFIPDWANWNYDGYEAATRGSDGRLTYRKSYPEYRALMTTMGDLGEAHGCGRAMWEHEEQHDRYGTPMALMLLPFWTDGCIGSMEGLYFEASATTPYHFLNQDELSWTPSNAQRELPYVGGPPTRAEFDKGVEHLQMAGVKWYMAINSGTQALADQHPALVDRGGSGPWKVYEVRDAPLVEGLRNRPVVITGQSTTGREWQDIAVCWWKNRSSWPTAITAEGPENWTRVERTHEPDNPLPAEQCRPELEWGWFSDDGPPATEPLPEVKVTNIVEDDDGISFDVDRVGVPVVVKTSYFPNWKATGAEGPYRSTPNFMVVIPTDDHVELSYGYTSLDVVSYLVTVLGIIGAVFLFRARPVSVAPPGRFWGKVERPDLYPPPVELPAVLVVPPVPPLWPEILPTGDDDGHARSPDGPHETPTAAPAAGDPSGVDTDGPDDRAL